MNPTTSTQTISESISSELDELGYTYIQQIGSGGHGTVHLVFSQSFQQYFIIKNSKGKLGLRDEFEFLKQLVHPNIINLYWMFSIDQNDFLVLEYCPGGSLQQLIDKIGAIHPPKLYSYCSQILSAVSYLHENKIAHLDIKPSNILLDCNGRLKLADFGISQYFDSEKKRDFRGSKIFMAPEVWSCVNNYDRQKADIYSLGVTFYVMSQGKQPWTLKPNLKCFILAGYYEPLTGIDPQFEEIIHNMMSVNPSERNDISKLIQNPLFRNEGKDSEAKQSILFSSSMKLNPFSTTVKTNSKTLIIQPQFASNHIQPRRLLSPRLNKQFYSRFNSLHR
jgi:serine/threonine protein kinase